MAAVGRFSAQGHERRSIQRFRTAFLHSEAGYVLIVTFGDDRQACREWLFSSLTAL
jgi:hypothetical protein